MAYIPPHKRLSKDEGMPTPAPTTLNPQVKKKFHSGRFASGTDKRKDKQNSPGLNIVYADYSKSRWLAVPLACDDRLPSSFYLEDVSLESVERRTGDKLLTMVAKGEDQESTNARECNIDSPWVFLAETVYGDLVSSSQHVKNEMKDQTEEIKPALVARFGNVVFHGLN